MSSTGLTKLIVLGLVLGIVAGYASHAYFPESAVRFAEISALLPTAFLRLIKMIIAPLVVSTLVDGIPKFSDSEAPIPWKKSDLT